MTATETTPDLTAAVRRLLEKYGKPLPVAWQVLPAPPPRRGDKGTTTLVPGWSLLAAEPDEAFVPLLPWRSERRFVELRRMVADRTVEPLLMCRFSCSTDGRPLDLAAVLYREFDLAEWLTGTPIAALTATIEGGRRANVIVRLADGVVCGVEAAATLPAATPMLDRHELIARRGVACDRVVDTQVPQSSVYTFAEAGARQYTDTDAELFGLSGDETNLVRAAYEALTLPDCIPALRAQHARLAGLVRLAFESDRRCERLTA